MIKSNASVIKITRLDKVTYIPENNARAVEKMLHCRRQELIRIVASHDGTLKVGNQYVGEESNGHTPH
jgi:hypothetical protein